MMAFMTESNNSYDFCTIHKNNDLIDFYRFFAEGRKLFCGNAVFFGSKSAHIKGSDYICMSHCRMCID